MKTNYTLAILALAILVVIPISGVLATSSDENCIDIDCLKKRLKQMCKEGAENIVISNRSDFRLFLLI